MPIQISGKPIIRHTCCVNKHILFKGVHEEMGSGFVKESGADQG